MLSVVKIQQKENLVLCTVTSRLLLITKYLTIVKYRVSAPGRSATYLHIQHTGRLRN